MWRVLIWICDLLNSAVTMGILVYGYMASLTPATGFVILPFLLLAAWGLFFGLRGLLQTLEARAISAGARQHRVRISTAISVGTKRHA